MPHLTDEETEARKLNAQQVSRSELRILALWVPSVPVEALCFFLHRSLGKHAVTRGVSAPKQLPRAPWSSWAGIFSWGDPPPWALLCPHAWGRRVAITEGAKIALQVESWRSPHCCAHCPGRGMGWAKSWQEGARLHLVSWPAGPTPDLYLEP